MRVKERDTPMLVGVSARVSQWEGRERKRDRERSEGGYGTERRENGRETKRERKRERENRESQRDGVTS